MWKRGAVCAIPSPMKRYVILFAFLAFGCGKCSDETSGTNNGGGEDVGVRPEQDVGEPCFGCFDEDGNCLSGDEDSACGEGGSDCQPCEEGKTCEDDGQCVEPPSCTPETCDGCCNSDGECVDGGAVDACGKDGGGCATCPEGAGCVDGVCLLGCAADNCNGCCDGMGNCVEPTTDVACGAAGSACVDCAATGGTCAGGACVAPGCQQTCAGCCAGDMCVDQVSAQQCGANGGACVACTGEQMCNAGVCETPPGGTWDLTILSADIADYKPDGAGWDSFGAPPDVYAEAYAYDSQTGDEWYYGTSVQDDTWTPVWNEVVLEGVTTAALNEGLEFLLVDLDDFFDDDICYGFVTVQQGMMNGMIVETTCDTDPDTKWRWKLEPH